MLLSARDTSAVYELDQRTGRILWTLGGKASTFRLAHGARFYFQHDATLLVRDRVSLFDDGAGPPAFEPESRGLILALNTRRHVARVVHQFVRPGHQTSAESEGSVQQLAGGNAFVGFGATPFFSEFSASGRLRFDAALPTDDGSYREYLFPWRATPRTRPVAVARRASGNAIAIDVSWNGSTTVTRWRVLARRSGALVPVTTVADRGFDTRITVHGSAGSFVVRALGKRGRVLGQSAPVKVSPGAPG